MIAHVSDYPTTLVTAYCDLGEGKCNEDIFEHPHVPDHITSPPLTLAGSSPPAVALISAREGVEPKSDRAAFDSAHAPLWQAFSSCLTPGRNLSLYWVVDSVCSIKLFAF